MTLIVSLPHSFLEIEVQINSNNCANPADKTESENGEQRWPDVKSRSGQSSTKWKMSCDSRSQLCLCLTSPIKI